MTHKGGQPSTEEGIVDITQLPIYTEGNLPSARQSGLVIAVDDGVGNIKIGVSREGTWYLFAHDTTVS